MYHCSTKGAFNFIVVSFLSLLYPNTTFSSYLVFGQPLHSFLGLRSHAHTIKMVSFDKIENKLILTIENHHVVLIKKKSFCWLDILFITHFFYIYIYIFGVKLNLGRWDCFASVFYVVLLLKLEFHLNILYLIIYL